MAIRIVSVHFAFLSPLFSILATLAVTDSHDKATAENRQKLKKIRDVKMKPYFMTKTANKGILKIKEYLDQNPEMITLPYIDHWWDRFWSIAVVCDPIQRLLSDFKHVTRDWSGATRNGYNAVNSKFLGPESVLYPFKNHTFDSMVDKFLPLVEMTVKQRPDEFKNFKNVMEMFRSGKFSVLERDYIGSMDHPVIFKNPGIVIDGGRMKTEPWTVFQGTKYLKYFKITFFF